MLTRFSFIIGMVVVMLVIGSASASRVTYTEIADPFSDGVCLKPEMQGFTHPKALEREPVGIGWPKGSLSGIVVCNSGFVYFADDSDLTDEEESRVREFLRKISWMDFSDVRSVSPELLVWILEETYKRREVDSRFWFEFHQAIAHLGPELDARRKARISEVFQARYSDFQDDAKIHYLMSGHFARLGLTAEACEALHRGDQIISKRDSVSSETEGATLSDYRAYAVADILSPEAPRHRRIRLSDCDDLRRRSEKIPDRRDPQ